MLYNCVEEQKKHKFYLECLSAPLVPVLKPVEVKTPLSPKKSLAMGSVYATNDDDVFGTSKEVYRRLMDSVPTQAASVPVILHCMVEQVWSPHSICMVKTAFKNLPNMYELLF